MHEEIIKLKGKSSGLQLVFEKGLPFSLIRNDIRQKLETGSRFFQRGTVIHAAADLLTKEQAKELESLFRLHGVLFRLDDSPTRKTHEKELAASNYNDRKKFAETKNPKSYGFDTKYHNMTAKNLLSRRAASEAEKVQMKVLNRTIRSGQEIRSEGSVLICGNVNAGAEIIAGGSIDIRGKCCGVVHAGAFGDNSAFIIADRLMPVQIRIADKIASAPDYDPKPTVPERASIKNGRIVIEPIER